MRTLFFIGVFFTATFLGIWSCARTSSQIKDCRPNGTRESLLLKNEEANIAFEATTYVEEIQNDYFSEVRIDRSTFNKLLKVINDQSLLKEKNIVALYLIVDNLDNIFEVSHIGSILTYRVEDEIYIARHRLKVDDDFIFNESNSYRTTVIRSNMANIVRSEHKLSKPSNFYRIVSFMLDDAADYGINSNQVDEFESMWIRKKSELFSLEKTNGPLPGDDFCPQPCGGPIGHECVQYDPENPNAMYCLDDEEPCFSQNVRNQLITTSSSLDSVEISLAFGFEQQTAIRDNILVNSVKGSQYVSYYYFLSDKMSSTAIPADVLIATTLILPKVYDRFSKLSNPAVYGSEVLLDQVLYDELIDLVKLYTPLFSDPTSLSILSTFSADMQGFKGKTVIEIRNSLGM